MNEMKFNLQLFSDEGENAAGGSSTSDVNVIDSGAIESPEDHAEPTAGLPYRLVIDEETGKRNLEFVEPVNVEGDHKSDAEDENPENNAAVEPTERENNVQFYTPDELIRAMTLNQVDENRIPPTLQGDYVALKTQRELDLARQKGQEEKPTENSAVNNGAQIENVIKLNAHIKEYSQRQALQDLGMTAEELEEFRYLDDENSRLKVKQFEERAEAYSRDIREKIDAQKFAEHRMRENARQLIQQAAPIIEEYKKDPAFAEIDIMMTTHFKQLPYEQAVQVVSSMNRMSSGIFDQNDLNILDAYYKITREAYYAKKNGISSTPKKINKPAKPPYVESPGNGQKTAESKINFRDMRSMDKRERSDFLQNILKQRLFKG